MIYAVDDVFTGGAEPIELFTYEFLQGLSNLLTSDGVIAIVSTDQTFRHQLRLTSFRITAVIYYFLPHCLSSLQSSRYSPSAVFSENHLPPYHLVKRIIPILLSSAAKGVASSFETQQRATSLAVMLDEHISNHKMRSTTSANC